MGYCDQLTHTVYLYIFPIGHIQGNLRERCINALTPGFAKGLCAHLIVPMPPKLSLSIKNLGRFVCVDDRRLNSIRDAFPLLHIDEALQVVHSSNVFTSFNLVQGYLQLAMAGDDIKKTAFTAGSSGLYEFIHMPFSLSNAGSSFCRLMEQYLHNQQFVTLLLYLDDICIFAPDVSTMLDQIELVFSQLKSFNLRLKPKKCYFFQDSVIFLGHILSTDGISANPEKVDKVRDWPVPKNAKELHAFLGLTSYY